MLLSAPTVIAYGPTNRRVKEGATVHLKCEVFGEPKPVISWRIDGKTVSILIMTVACKCIYCV